MVKLAVATFPFSPSVRALALLNSACASLDGVLQRAKQTEVVKACALLLWSSHIVHTNHSHERKTVGVESMR